MTDPTFLHVGLTVSDLDRSRRFYEALGFVVFYERVRRREPWLERTVGISPATLSFCHMRGQGLWLELIEYLEHSWVRNWSSPSWPATAHLAFQVVGVDSWYKALPALGGQLITEGGPQENPSGPQAGSRGFYGRDPDGLILELWEPAQGRGALA